MRLVSLVKQVTLAHKSPCKWADCWHSSCGQRRPILLGCSCQRRRLGQSRHFRLPKHPLKQRENIEKTLGQMISPCLSLTKSANAMIFAFANLHKSNCSKKGLDFSGNSGTCMLKQRISAPLPLNLGNFQRRECSWLQKVDLAGITLTANS